MARLGFVLPSCGVGVLAVDACGVFVVAAKARWASRHQAGIGVPFRRFLENRRQSTHAFLLPSDAPFYSLRKYIFGDVIVVKTVLRFMFHVSKVSEFACQFELPEQLWKTAE